MQRILYAEDNAGMRKMVCHFLSTVGFEIIATTDGDEALELAKQEVFDVILLDVTMERMDGTDTAIEIRKSSLNQETPIVGLTGRTDANEIEMCKAAGMDIVLPKPVDLEGLAITLASDIKAEIEIAQMQKDAAQFNAAPKVIDVEVLHNYAKIAGANSLQGILHDFSDLWPRKIGELYAAIVLENSDAVARASEELCAIAAGIGAGKVASCASKLVSMHDRKECEAVLPELTIACNEVQAIINALSNKDDLQIQQVA